MATIKNLLEDWVSFDDERLDVYSHEQGVITRWINQAQLMFADKSECIRGIWTPTLSSSGSVALPSDFLRAVKDRVKWSTNWYLREIDYPSANIMTFGSVAYYSVWGDTFYVWNGGNGTPTIPYIKKPTAITTSTIATADFEIPTEYHQHLFLFLDGMMARRKRYAVTDKHGNFMTWRDNVQVSDGFFEQFYIKCANAKADYSKKHDIVPQMEGNFF